MKFGSGVAPVVDGNSHHTRRSVPRVLAGRLDLYYLLLLCSDIFHDPMQVVNVAVSYLLKSRDVHLYLVPTSEKCSRESAPARCSSQLSAVCVCLKVASYILYHHI